MQNNERPVSGANGSGDESADLPAPSVNHQQRAQRILLVEDDPALASLEAGVLTAQGFEVVAVQSGELAIQTLRHILPDLVVLDLELTGTITGQDVLDALRAPQTSSPIPVLLTTSSAIAARASMRMQGESKGTLDHLPKPYPMQTLLKRVRRMLKIVSS
jgi:twitching motility two-component system response regulator PilH